MADRPPLYACPRCGREARLNLLHADGTPAPPHCVADDVDYVPVRVAVQNEPEEPRGACVGDMSWVEIARDAHRLGNEPDQEETFEQLWRHASIDDVLHDPND